MKSVAPTAPPRRILRQRTVLDRLPDRTNRSTLWRWERAGLFPQRVQLGPNSIGYYSDEVEAWFAARERPIGTGSAAPIRRAHQASDELVTR
jgi:predicted DNA-binding transcriptional regulator AlpA